MDNSGLRCTLHCRFVDPNRVVDPPFRGVQLSQSVNTHVRSLELLVLLTCDLISHPGFLRFPLLRLGRSDTLDYMVKPHGQLVLVSSTPHSAYTPSLSTS